MFNYLKKLYIYLLQKYQVAVEHMNLLNDDGRTDLHKRCAWFCHLKDINYMVVVKTLGNYNITLFFLFIYICLLPLGVLLHLFNYNTSYIELLYLVLSWLHFALMARSRRGKTRKDVACVCVLFNLLLMILYRITRKYLATLQNVIFQSILPFYHKYPL